jgi:restriction system protein
MSNDPQPLTAWNTAAITALRSQWRARAESSGRAANIGSGAILLAPLKVSGTGTATPPPSAPEMSNLLPTLLMQTLIIRESNTDEGMLVEAVTIPWREILRLIKDDPNLIYQIDPWKWEEIIAGSYQTSALFDEVVLTPRSGDHGRDVIATRHGFCSIRCIESVKRYSPGRVVTADDVRSLGFAMLADPKVTKGIVSTTWEFAPRIEDDPNIKSLLPHRLELVNKNALLERFQEWARLH